MREIKFRGYSKYMKKFVYGYFLKKNNEAYIARSMFGGLLPETVEPESIGQFTGLKDINEKEIYEGDIILWSDGHKSNDYIDIVIFKDGSFRCRNINSLLPYDSGGGKLFYPKVIGNIYENPELLKG